MSHRRLLLSLQALAMLAAVPGPTAAFPREYDPVVLQGSSLPWLLGTPPHSLAAFRYEGGWTRIAVQVDERAVVDFGTIYDTTATGFTVLTYTDTSTFTGPDPDPALDGDDEVVCMARDAGDPAPGSGPPGVALGIGVEVRIVDPLGGAPGFVYLFINDGTLPPEAGPHPVSYAFDLLSGPYKLTYNTISGFNPEDSRATSAVYSVHFSDRWIRDETSIHAGSASGVDLLDRHKDQFGPGVCERTEQTFSKGEGAFIVNREGPVRALRAYVGANSGPTTHRIHRFYAAREEIQTVLRVHPIPGIVDYFDYSPAAAGMTYFNDLNPGGVTVDGVPETPVAGAIEWEMVSGPQGTLAIAHRLVTDIAGFAYTSYYLDNSTMPVRQCTGDAYAYGASGPWIDTTIPNTDPAAGTFKILETFRTLTYAPPGENPAFAAARAAEVAAPIVVSTSTYPAPAAVGPRPPGGALRLVVGPNPVRGTLRARFSLARAQALALRVFDASGRCVATLAEGRREAGAHEVVADVSSLESGVYFARALLQDGSSITARIVALR